MPKWEYKVLFPRIEIKIDRIKAIEAGEKPELDSIAEVLNKYGQEGWELVSVGSTDMGRGEQPVAYLKRPLT